MAENVLVKEVLTDRMIAAGQGLADTLEERGWPYAAIFWLYNWESNRWDLVVASHLFERPTDAAYDAVNDAVDASTPKVDIFWLLLISDRNQNVRELVELAGRGLSLDGWWHRGPIIEDSYVYRVRATAAAPVA